MAHSIIDSFLRLLKDSKMSILSIDFAFHLHASSTEDIASWNITNDSQVSPSSLEKILVPLHDVSECHWGLAVLRKNDKFIEVYDSRHTERIFFNLMPKFLHWTATLRASLQQNVVH